MSPACLAPNRASAEKWRSVAPNWTEVQLVVYNMHFESFLRKIYALCDCFWWLSRKRNFVALKRWLKHSLGCSERRVTTI